MSFNRFDFEQQIMSCWNVTEDIKLVYENVLDRETPLTEDELANVLLGLEHLYQLKFERLFEMFEQSSLPIHSREEIEKYLAQCKEDK